MTDKADAMRGDAGDLSRPQVGVKGVKANTDATQFSPSPPPSRVTFSGAGFPAEPIQSPDAPPLEAPSPSPPIGGNTIIAQREEPPADPQPFVHPGVPPAPTAGTSNESTPSSIVPPPSSWAQSGVVDPPSRPRQPLSDPADDARWMAPTPAPGPAPPFTFDTPGAWNTAVQENADFDRKKTAAFAPSPAATIAGLDASQADTPLPLRASGAEALADVNGLPTARNRIFEATVTSDTGAPRGQDAAGASAPGAATWITEQRLAANIIAIRDAAIALANRIKEQINDTNASKPNDERLAAHEAFVGFLEMVAGELFKLAEALDRAIEAAEQRSRDQEKIFLGTAGRIVEHLKLGLFEYLERERANVVGLSIKISLAIASLGFAKALGVDVTAIVSDLLKK